MREQNLKEQKVRNTQLLIIFSLLIILANCFVAEMSENKKNYHTQLRKDIDGLKAEYSAKIVDLEKMALHANRTILDAYTQEKVNLVDALNSKLQKEIIDLIARIINVEKVALHNNRVVLDTYTQSEYSLADLVSNKLGKKIAELEIRIADLEKRMRQVSEKEGNNDSK